MAFDLLPALDLKGGRVATMERGDPSTLAQHDRDPLDVARGYAAAGAGWIHVVDLDAALGGTAANLDLLARVAELPVRVQAGGGLSPGDVEAALSHGASRAVLGSAWLEDRAAVRALLRRRGRAVAVGLDVRSEMLSPRGGRSAERALEPVLAWLAGADPKPGCLVVTAVERDGTMQGPDITLLETVADRTGIAIVASGGVRSLKDIRALAALQPKVVGAVVGRALSEGAVPLREALALCADLDLRPSEAIIERR